MAINSISGSTSGSLLRISGLASGIDTESMIKQLMDAERIPLNKLFQDRQLLQWKQEKYREIYASLKELRDSAFDMKLQGTFLAKQVVSTDESVVTATATTASANISYTFKNVTLATAESTWGDSIKSGTYTGTISTTQTFKQLADANVFAVPLDTTASTQQFTIKSYDQNGKVLSDTISIDINQDSIATLVDKINKSKAGVNAFFDTNSNKLVITSKLTGDNNSGSASIQINDSTGNLMNGVMGMLSGDTLDSSKRQLGSDASFQINGLSTTRKSNIFTIDGTTFTLKGASGSNDVTVSVNNDVDKVYDTIKSFIDQYNKTLDLLNTTTAEKRYRDYPPLLDEQKKDMKDSEIELWEEKAKSGLLSNDALLQRAISNFRTTIYARVGGMTGQIDQLAEIGITTESYTDSEGGVVITGGKLVIDEQKLRDALVNSPDEVMDLFTKSSDTPGEKGIANRLYDTVNQVMSDIIDKAGRDDNDTNSALYKQMKDMNTRIDDMQRHLTDVENRYYAQFSAMEQALNQMNQQSMWLMQQFGGGQ